MKRRVAILIGSLSLAACNVLSGELSSALDVPVPAVELSTDSQGLTRLMLQDDSWALDIDSPGTPGLPRRGMLFAVPDGYSVTSAELDPEWTVVAENVEMSPVPEVTRGDIGVASSVRDAAAYSTDVFPQVPVRMGSVEEMSGVRVVPVSVCAFRWHPRTGRLERASRLRLTVRFAENAGTRSQAWSEAHAEAVRAVVQNPDAVTVRMKSGRQTASRLVAADNRAVYLLISPPDFYEDWLWYVEQRSAVHPDVRFIVKNTAEIYAEYPFGKGLPRRNAAESVHAYVRSEVEKGAFYVVLGGPWLDAQNRKNQTVYFASGELMSLSNCVPGVYGFPRENWREIPSDMFYACGVKDGQAHPYPWDANGDGVYIDQNDCRNNDLTPDVAVSRITLNAWGGNSSPRNPHEVLTNYVAKLKRGEARNFAGHYRYGVSADSTGSRRWRANRDRMWYRELEFYDGMYNMFDPRHHDQIEDNEKATRERFHGQFSLWRPVRSVKGMFRFTWTQGLPSLSAAIDDYYASDMDYGFVYSHGWAMGATHFMADRFGSGKGLTLLNGSNGPCDTGYPDYYVTYNGKLTLAYNLGDSGVSNPKGGALCSINNTRWGWAGGSNGYDESMSYLMLNRSLIGFNQLRYDVGHSWLKGVRDYANCGAPQYGSTSTWTLTEQICYGDPLVRLPQLPDCWWTGSESGGVWDETSELWTNNVDSVRSFGPANNVYFAFYGPAAFDVAGDIAAMRLSMPLHAPGKVRLAGKGTLRVMSCIDVAGEDAALELDVAGGVGHSGVRFLGTPGVLNFTGTNRFYLASVTNAIAVNLNGGGVTLDVGEFPAGGRKFPLLFNGPGTANLPEPNILRSLSIGGLLRFGPLAMTNTYVRLETTEAFGTGAQQTNALVDSRLEIGANAAYQLSGYPEPLNAYFNVSGASSLANSLGGVWTVSRATTFDLAQGADLTLSASAVDAGGSVVLKGSGRVRVTSANALAGDVTVSRGVTLMLDALPLSGVRSLTVEEGAKIVLPEEESGYWQIVPVSSKMHCNENVVFASAREPETSLDGSPSLTGAFFKEGAIYSWPYADGEWDRFLANRHPKIVFGDLDVITATVRVQTVVSPDFAFFSNQKTRYVFTSASDESEVHFKSVLFCGDTTFDLPVSASEYVVLSSGTTTFRRVSSPVVQVNSGAALSLAGSHWTTFKLDQGAVLMALPGESLDWNSGTQIEFPEGSRVSLDLSALMLNDGPIVLIRGSGRVWSTPDLALFAVNRSDASLCIVNGALCVQKGDGLVSPYRREVSGECEWDSIGWCAANDVAFPSRWSASSLDWLADIVLDVAEESVLKVNADIHANVLTVRDNGASSLVLARAAAVDPVFDVSVLDLVDAPSNVTIEIETGDASIVLPTNELAQTRLAGRGKGSLTLKGSTLLLDNPGDWTLSAGAQGTLRFVAPQAQQRFRIAFVSTDFELGGLELEVTDRFWNRVDGFTFSVSGGALWCMPPALHAVVPPGTNEIQRLDWRDALDVPVSPVDWSYQPGFNLIGTPTSGVVIATHGFESLWGRLSASNTVKLLGGETLTPQVLPTGPGILELCGGFTVKVDLSARQQLLNGSCLAIGEGSTLEISHGNGNFDASGQNWRGITGTGRVVLVGSNTCWLSLPNDPFGDGLTVETSSELVLTQRISPSNPIGVRNFSGTGNFRSDWGSGSNMRPVRTVQTRCSRYSGVFAAISGVRDSKLVVGSDSAEPNVDKALILDGKAVAPHVLDIETNGCVILTGSWQGTINVKGLLIVTNESALAQATVVPAGAFEVRAAVPDIPNLPSYEPPTYPEDPNYPEPPDEPEEPELPRNLHATVLDNYSNWSDLVWLDETNCVVTEVDWSAVTNVTLTSSKPRLVLSADVPSYSGVATFLGDLRLEVNHIPKFTLNADSTCRIDLRLQTPPIVTTDLIVVMNAPVSSPSGTVVSVLDRFGRTPQKPGSVEYGNGRFYFLVQELSQPTWSVTFEGSCFTTLSTAPGFAEASTDSSHFTASRSGRALMPKGATPYINGSLPSQNGCVTYHAVLRMPEEANKIMICCGSVGGAGSVWLVSGGSDTVVLRNASRTFMTVAVPLSARQFHAYAMVMDSSTLKLYVDGTLAQSCSLGSVPESGLQFFKLLGNNGYGLSSPSSTSTAAIDDWRCYSECLTETSVRALAAEFTPWPEYPEALVDCEDLDWNDLQWQGKVTATTPLRLIGSGGSLNLSGDHAVSQALAVVGAPISVRLGSNGMLRVPAGLGIATSSALLLDVSRLNLTNLAARAVAGVPYTQWVVRGPVSGDVRLATEPVLPKFYSLEVENVSGVGVRLVFTAPDFASFDSVGVSIGSDSFAGLQDNIGLHPSAAASWHPYSPWTNLVTAIDGISVYGKAGGNVDSQSPYGRTDAVPRYFWSTSFDGNGPVYDGVTNEMSFAGLADRFGAYRVIVYMATDTDNARFSPVIIESRSYAGAFCGSAEKGSFTVMDSTVSAWGAKSSTPREGVNAVASDVLTNDAITVSSVRRYASDQARAQIAAVQFVKVGAIVESGAVVYEAEITGDATWDEGKGDGLNPNAEWSNDPYSTISLMPVVPDARVCFNTPMTAEVIRVKSGANKPLRLERLPEVPFAVGMLDLTESRGLVAITNWPMGMKFLTSKYTRLRVEDPVTQPVSMTAGATFSYHDATFSESPSSFNWILRLDEQDDKVRLPNSWQFMPIDIRGGSLTFAAGAGTGETGYGGNGSGDTNSVMVISGGRVVCNVNGRNTANSGSNRGFIIGATASVSQQPRVYLNGGELLCENGLLAPWEYAKIFINGGRLRALGVLKGGNNAGALTMTSGSLEVGSFGLGIRSDAKSKVFPLCLSGGVVLAYENATCSLDIELSGDVMLSAESGKRLTVTGSVSGSGVVTCGSDAHPGEVAFVRDDFTAVVTNCVMNLVTSRQEGEFAVFASGTLALNGVSVNGLLLDKDEWQQNDGTIVIHRNVKLDNLLDGDDKIGSLSLSAAWLAKHGIDRTALAANPLLAGANGYPLWQNYVLGLDPADEMSRPAATIGFEDGKLKVSATGLAAERAAGAAVRYRLQSSGELTGEFTTIATKVDDQTFDDIKTEDSRRFFRLLIDILWK